MDFNNIKNKLKGLDSKGFQHLKHLLDGGISHPSFKALKDKVLKKSYVYWLGGGAIVYALYAFVFSGGEATAPQQQNTKPVVKTMAELTPLSSVDERDAWVSRIEKSNEEVLKEVQKTRDENLFLSKEIDNMRKSLEKLAPNFIMEKQELVKREGGNATSETPSSNDSQVSKSSHVEFSEPSGPQHFPKMGTAYGQGDIGDQSRNKANTSNTNPGIHKVKAAKPKAKLSFLTETGFIDNSARGADHYLPAGTYLKAVISMGVVCSVGTNSISDPQPIKLRVVDNGNLPGGLKGRMRDAVLLGACHGEASSERAKCRLHTLSWRDPSGRQIEKPISGWIASEDGMQGIRGKIVDRSSEIAREALGAGLLSAASNFLKFEASSSVYPMTPFGQTNALSKENAIKGAIGSGAGSALDKLAEFSIKRAEAMSPVVLVYPGRVVEAVLLKGVDLAPNFHQSMQLANQTTSSQPAHETQPQGESQ